MDSCETASSLAGNIMRIDILNTELAFRNLLRVVCLPIVYDFWNKKPSHDARSYSVLHTVSALSINLPWIR